MHSKIPWRKHNVGEGKNRSQFDRYKIVDIRSVMNKYE
jgi:hypothetical protein